MHRASANSTRGFTLIELLVSLALGMLVIGTAVQLFSKGVNATFVVSQRAEMQQNQRATSNLMIKDISLAGSGLPSGTGIALATGTGIRPIYGWAPGCAAKNNCAPGNGIAYPCSSLVGPCVPTLYGLIPGFQLGIKPPGAPTNTDVITSVYTDTVFALNCYQLTSIAPTVVTMKVPNPLPPTCILTPPLVAPQAVTDPVVGLTPGDLVLFQSTVGGNTAMAVAEVTLAADNGGGNYTVQFANGDPLNLNQTAAASGDLAQLAVNPPAVPPVTATATRILVNSYYLWMLPDPLGVGPGVPTLMRQVSGHTPIPVAENVVNMQFTYDTYDANGVLLNATGDGGYSLGVSYNLIRKVNLTHLTMRSQVAGARSGLMTTNGYQSFDTQTSISARNLSYQNRYDVGP